MRSNAFYRSAFLGKVLQGVQVRKRTSVWHKCCIQQRSEKVVFELRNSRLSKRSLSTFFGSKSSTHYDTLHLERDASDSEIKVSYFRLAKKLHPDRKGADKGDVTDFLKLVEAYEILSCPNKRLLYDRELEGFNTSYSQNASLSLIINISSNNDEKSPGNENSTSTRWNMNGGSNGYSDAPDYGFDEPYTPGWKKHEIAEYRKGLGMLENIKLEFHEAVHMAYHGPRVPDFERVGLGKSIMFPWAFEVEVRSSEDHEDIVQLVSGRQVLGYVRNSSYDSSAEIESENGKILDAITADNLSLDLYYQGTKVARAVKSNTKNGVDIQVYGTKLNSPDDSSMELLGSVKCTDRDENTLSVQRILKKLPTLSLRPPKEQSIDKGLGPSKSGIRCFEFHSALGKPTHLLVQQRTLGVSHQYWFANSTKRLSCDIKCHKAWSPGPAFWFWEPRAETHGTETWTFEIARPHVEEQALIEEVWEILNSRNNNSGSVIPREAKLKWAVEAATAKVREQSGALDCRVAIMFTAFASLP